MLDNCFNSICVTLFLCVNCRDDNYKRKFKTPYIINSYGKDINIDSPRKNRRKTAAPRMSPTSTRKIGAATASHPRNHPIQTDKVPLYSVPNKKLPRLAVEGEIYVVSSDCDENDVIPKPRPKKGIMKKPTKSVHIKTGDDSGIEDPRDIKRVYDADNSSYSEDSFRRFKVKKGDNIRASMEAEGLQAGMEDDKSPYRYVYSEW